MYGEVRQNSIGISATTNRISTVEMWHTHGGRRFLSMRVEKRPDRSYVCCVADPEYGRHYIEGATLRDVIGFMTPDAFAESLQIAFSPGVRPSIIEEAFPGFIFVDVE